ncbi:hypothetical protein OIO90_001685 [Microbotryomycetes sp. JL221]|nr:hypothetical protein OIO90_001685 [Microbotryomycetes sp. JL221]
MVITKNSNINARVVFPRAEGPSRSHEEPQQGDQVPINMSMVKDLEQPEPVMTDDKAMDDNSTSSFSNSAKQQHGISTTVTPIVGAATGPFAKFTKWLESIGVEARGLDRVPESERTSTSYSAQTRFWFSVNMSVSSLVNGSLGQQFYTLKGTTSIAIIIPMTALGCCCSAYVATLGPPTGLRTLALTRFAAGRFTFVLGIINALIQISYGVTTAIAGAQVLRAVNHDLSLIVGIVIISAVVFVICVFGLRWAHYFERWCFIPCFIIYVIILGLGSRGHYDLQAGADTQDKGAALVGDVLSFAGICFSIASAWTSIAADYNTYAPSNSSRGKIFAATWLGTFIPICFINISGAALWSITEPSYVAAREQDGLGGILGAVLEPSKAFGKILLVILAFSTIAANIPNTYSGALSLQSLHPILLKVPRVVFVIIVTAAYVAAACAGREHFSEIVANFAAILSYYTAGLFALLLLEFGWFRRRNGILGKIDPDEWCNWKVLPPGYACAMTFCITVGAAVVSMATVFWTGPIAKLVTEPYGGDLGFEFSFVFTFVFFFIFRTIEIRYFKR